MAVKRHIQFEYLFWLICRIPRNSFHRFPLVLAQTETESPGKKFYFWSYYALVSSFILGKSFTFPSCFVAKF
ncbi:hypothetical protein CUMW_254560 [Citrus unshiu]|uniref:Uncharacterized protein n=1 Tax=Citrus sinensis TaxID=2711 RepID=A0A067DFV5_CITSI|nr:hypothetical protein CISIN_1g036080mg [Citrus sinensis]GAY67186.1 hypothetical protein CUMW_254560 [Citrus unshiu]